MKTVALALLLSTVVASSAHARKHSSIPADLRGHLCQTNQKCSEDEGIDVKAHEIVDREKSARCRVGRVSVRTVRIAGGTVDFVKAALKCDLGEETWTGEFSYWPYHAKTVIENLYPGDGIRVYYGGE
jgi:hypothetical protein